MTIKRPNFELKASDPYYNL